MDAAAAFGSVGVIFMGTLGLVVSVGILSLLCYLLFAVLTGRLD